MIATTFIIGDGYIVERLRRDARQLCVSKFSSIRDASNFTRRKNSSLKCDLDKTVRRCEKAKNLKCGEIDRARVELSKKQNREHKRDLRRDVLIPNFRLHTAPNVGCTGVWVDRTKSSSQCAVTFKKKSAGASSRKAFSAGPIARTGAQKHALTRERSQQQQQQQQLGCTTTLDNQTSSNRNKIAGGTVADPLLEVRKRSRGNWMRAGRNLSETSEKERDENNHSNSRKAWCVTSEEPVRPSNRRSKKAAGFGSSNKDNPSDSKQLRKTAKENKDEWMWQRFDEIMIGLTDFLNSEYKPRSLKATVEALLRTVDREKGKRSKPMNSPGHLSSFYFKFGAPDQVTFRC